MRHSLGEWSLANIYIKWSDYCLFWNRTKPNTSCFDFKIHFAYLLICELSNCRVLWLNIDQQCTIVTEAKQSKSSSMIVNKLFKSLKCCSFRWWQHLHTANKCRKVRWLTSSDWPKLWKCQAVSPSQEFSERKHYGTERGKMKTPQHKSFPPRSLTLFPSFFATSFCHHHTRLLAKPRIGHTQAGMHGHGEKSNISLSFCCSFNT